MATVDSVERPDPGQGPSLGHVRPASEIPGLAWPKAVVSLLGVLRPVAARLEMRRRYGRIFRTDDLIAGRVFHVADRALVAEMFGWKPSDYTVAEPRELMSPIVGQTSLLLLDGERHLRMRKLTLPPFHGEAILQYEDLIAEVTREQMADWRPGQRIQTRTVAQRITMDVIIRIVFGITDPQRIQEMRLLLPRLSSVSPLLLIFRDRGERFGPWAAFVRRRDRVDRLIFEEISRRRANAVGDRGDILELLLNARDEVGEPLSDQEIRDELITMLLAGHETTATSIGWAFERLLRSPSALERLTQEVQDPAGGEYLEAVIKETLRVRPVVSEVFRSPSRVTELGGFRFDPGAQLAASILLIQYDPELFGPDPFEFRPERFLEGAPDSYAWIPFGGGVRRCIGASFAQLEMRVVIATILRHSRLRAARPRDESTRFRGVTLLPSRGGEAIVESL